MFPVRSALFKCAGTVVGRNQKVGASNVLLTSRSTIHFPQAPPTVSPKYEQMKMGMLSAPCGGLPEDPTSSARAGFETARSILCGL